MKPIINLDQIRYVARPQDFAPKGDLANEFDVRIGRVANQIGAQKLGQVEYVSFQGRESMTLDYWDGEGEP